MPPTHPPEHTITLSHGQRKVLKKVQQGENVFFTGSAGTGKSVLLREIIKSFGDVGPGKVAITASTGIAAVKIGGTTLHSFAGVGLGKNSPEELVRKIRFNRILLRRWLDVEVLIMDEVSMIDGVFFDKLNYMACKIRQNTAPFGGIQLIVTGDFFQLPPIPDRVDGIQIPIVFAFDAKTWNQCFGPPIILTKGFRQKEKEFVNMLNEIRLGRFSASTAVEFKNLNRVIRYEDGIGPTELFPLRREVEGANQTQLECLSGCSYTYTAADTPGFDKDGNEIDPGEAERSLDRLAAEKKVTLKVGAQVMLIRNLAQDQLVNGILGKVTGFKTIGSARESGLPVAEAYSIRGPGSTSLAPEYDKKMWTMWPVVRFANSQELLCVPTKFFVVDAYGQLEAERDQIPLILAWALSIHKSQGQTFERLKIDLSQTFEMGQAYVALSRATNMETLQVLNFSSHKVMVHPRVLAWHDEMMQNADSD